MVLLLIHRYALAPKSPCRTKSGIICTVINSSTNYVILPYTLCLQLSTVNILGQSRLYHAKFLQKSLVLSTVFSTETNNISFTLANKQTTLVKWDFRKMTHRVHADNLCRETITLTNSYRSRATASTSQFAINSVVAGCYVSLLSVTRRLEKLICRTLQFGFFFLCWTTVRGKGICLTSLVQKCNNKL